MSRRSSKFTLLEICLAIAILALLAGAIGVGFKSGYQDYAFKTSVRQFAAHLREAQQIALAYQTGIRIELHAEKGDVYYVDSADEPRSPIQKRRKTYLRGIDGFTWNQKKKNSLPITILPSGRIEMDGVLCLKKGEHKKWISLKNPLSIMVANEEPSQAITKVPSNYHEAR